MKWRGAWVIVVLGSSLVHCGGTTEDSPGSGGTGASGGSSGSAASGGTGATSGAGGSAGSVDFGRCEVNSECLLRPESCCGSCGAATRGDAIAINQKYASQYSERVCEDQGCPACAAPQDPTLLAACRSGQCHVVDLLEHPSTECQSASDCRVRTTDCCECGGAMDSEHLVAISIQSGAEFDALVCDPNLACPECEPVYPPVTLSCVAGHCQIDAPQ